MTLDNKFFKLLKPETMNDEMTDTILKLRKTVKELQEDKVELLTGVINLTEALKLARNEYNLSGYNNFIVEGKDLIKKHKK